MGLPIKIPRTKPTSRRTTLRPRAKGGPKLVKSGCCGRGLGGGKTLVPKK